MRTSPSRSACAAFAALEAAGILSLLLPFLMGVAGICEYVWTTIATREVLRREMSLVQGLGLYVEPGVQTLLTKLSLPCSFTAQSEASRMNAVQLDDLSSRIERSITRLLSCESKKCAWEYEIHTFFLEVQIDTETGHIIGFQNPECHDVASSTFTRRPDSLRFRFRTNMPGRASTGGNYMKSLDYLNSHISRAWREDELAIPGALFGTKGSLEFSQSEGAVGKQMYLRSSPLLFSRVQLRPKGATPLAWLFALMGLIRDGETPAFGISYDALPATDFARLL